MNEATRTAVALLFDDAELGGQLRAALSERGAHIVHEGALAGFDHARLLEAGASVVVVNLDDAADDDALDRLYGMLEGDRPRVVFNDAQASRGLDGWDRARWARHLAVKVMAEGDIDPPRPEAARPAAATAGPRGDVSVPLAHAASVGEAAVEALPEPPPTVAPPPLPSAAVDDVESPQTTAESESLAAELEALLAADEPLAGDADEAFSTASPGESLPPLFDDQGGIMQHQDDAHVEPIHAESAFALADAGVDSSVAEAEKPVARAFDLDHLSLLDNDENTPPLATAPHGEASAPEVPAWDLLDEDAMVAAPTPAVETPVHHDASAFGIEKVSAAEFLAPDADAAHEASPIEPGLSLELVSIEEAIAPQHYEPNEFVLDDLGSALSRLVVLGATTEGTESVCRFLAALPAGLRATVLHTQHLAGKPADALVDYLSQHCALPVRLAKAGMRARTGEVLVVPSDQQVRLLRDGSTELQPTSAAVGSMPSIDASFTMAAGVFGRDALGIVFAGSSTDAVGGCQAIHDRGGKVWVEASPGEHFADMVSGVMAEHLSQFSGTPQELAARLVEEFQMEGRQ
jgi:two-component system chemotaxis response regulator CheB/chemosensory pili system protein ChpB (putative protein-glutamate methylesterase)